MGLFSKIFKSNEKVKIVNELIPEIYTDNIEVQKDDKPAIERRQFFRINLEPYICALVKIVPHSSDKTIIQTYACMTNLGAVGVGIISDCSLAEHGECTVYVQFDFMDQHYHIKSNIVSSERVNNILFKYGLNFNSPDPEQLQLSIISNLNKYAINCKKGYHRGNSGSFCSKDKNGYRCPYTQLKIK